MFGTFGKLFRIFPHYLPLLHLQDLSQYKEDVSPISLDLSLKKINKIFKRKSRTQIKKGANLLLKSINWRTHLVGCIAIVKMNQQDQREYIERLWGLILNDKSWTYQQILATLSIIDSDFTEMLKKVETKESNLQHKVITEEMKILINPNMNKENERNEYTIGLDWKNNLEKLLIEGRM